MHEYNIYAMGFAVGLNEDETICVDITANMYRCDLFGPLTRFTMCRQARETYRHSTLRDASSQLYLSGAQYVREHNVEIATDKRGRGARSIFCEDKG